MSEEKEEYNPANVKCLSLSSGLLVIGYVREVTDFGAYVVERPMNVFEEEDEVDGKTYMGLMPYNPLADNEDVHYFQSFGVIAISNIAEKTLSLYYKGVREQVAAEQNISVEKLVEDVRSMNDVFEEYEENIATKSEESGEVVDLASWTPNKADLKH